MYTCRNPSSCPSHPPIPVSVITEDFSLSKNLNYLKNRSEAQAAKVKVRVQCHYQKYMSEVKVTQVKSQVSVTNNKFKYTSPAIGILDFCKQKLTAPPIKPSITQHTQDIAYHTQYIAQHTRDTHPGHCATHPGHCATPRLPRLLRNTPRTCSIMNHREWLNMYNCQFRH